MQSWDSFDAYLFDLDGTLLHCNDAVHYFGFCHALGLISGLKLDLQGVVAHGNTDLGILRDALTAAAIPPSVWRPLLPMGVAALEQFVIDRQQEMVVVCESGASDVLSYLLSKGAALGIATGNLSAIGKIKLNLAGLDRFFTHHGFSDGLENREDVFSRALQRLRADDPDVATVCVVGDTPRDVQAAHANGLPAIAVASGTFSIAELVEACPEYYTCSLTQLLQCCSS